MFRRALLASSRAVSSSSKLIAQHPSVRSHFSPTPLSPLRATLPARTRWYSDQADATTKKEGEEAAPESEAKKSEEASESPSSVEAELKKKLEAKEREAIDWKVRLPTADGPIA